MSTSKLQQLFVELPDGWTSRIDIKQTANGRYAGVAELSLQGLKWGVLVFMQQPSLEAALARVRLRASQFARAAVAAAGQRADGAAVAEGRKGKAGPLALCLSRA